MNVICAEEAREIADYGIVENEILRAFFDFVRKESGEFHYQGFFDAIGCPRNKFSIDELRYLTEVLKYNIFWDNEYLWYEVRW